MEVKWITLEELLREYPTQDQINEMFSHEIQSGDRVIVGLKGDE